VISTGSNSVSVRSREKSLLFSVISEVHTIPQFVQKNVLKQSMVNDFVGATFGLV